MPAADFARLARRLLAWYDKNRRDLPWRAAPGETLDPYRIWLSEIMLQQTTVAAVIPYYEKFLARWPRVTDLAKAKRDDVMAAWAGLGYYARARNLHACAQEIAFARNGRFPDSEERLRELPGIGSYTAGAIAAIAFHRKAAAVDANAERVLARLYGLSTPLPRVKKEIHAKAQALVPAKRPGDFAGALMDLGATLCTPKKPACTRCPWNDACAAKRLGRMEDFPFRAKPKTRPVRYGVALWLTRADGRVLLKKRPDTGLLGGMLEFPGTPWRETPWTDKDAKAHLPKATRMTAQGVVRHVFTHFALELSVWSGAASGRAPQDGQWARKDQLADLALPSVMHKVARLALSKSL